ncbi:MAG: mechanosensitive ion channel family protein [Dehalococcoidia bacterium]|nr:MAG: mechanosensitive ion channel family protein [Dehalococcoidia bacterium]
MVISWSIILNWFGEYGWRILLLIAIYVALYFVIRRFIPLAVGKAVKRTMKNKPKALIKKRTNTLSSVFIQTGMIGTGIIVLFTILAQLGINVGPALAGLGVAGIAVGFGAQSLIKDILNGFLILLENQYGIDDVVKVAGVIGLVEEVGLRRTVLRDLDGILHSIPNGEIGVASNYTREWSRINMNISVGYGEDLRHVIQVINRVGKGLTADPEWTSRIIKAPEVLRVDAFDDSGIAIKILGQTQAGEQWNVLGEFRLRLKEVFDKEGIEIPWPHTKVFFGNAPGEISSKAHIEQKPPSPPPSKRKRPAILAPEDEGEGEGG